MKLCPYKECKSNYTCRGTITISALETGNFKGGAGGAQVPVTTVITCVHMYTSLDPNCCPFYSPVYTRPLTRPDPNSD